MCLLLYSPPNLVQHLNIHTEISRQALGFVGGVTTSEGIWMGMLWFGKKKTLKKNQLKYFILA